MKKIEAIVKPFKLEGVESAWGALGVEGMPVSEVKGFGRQKGHTEIHRGSEHVVDFLPKIKIGAGFADALINPAVEAVVKLAKTGKIGVGKVLSVPFKMSFGFAPEKWVSRRFERWLGVNLGFFHKPI